MELVLPQWFLWSLITLLSLKFIIKTLKPSRRLPPGPWPLPVVGNMFAIGDKPHRSLARLAKTYGPLMSVRLGQVTTVVITSPDMAREALQTKDQVFNGRSAPDCVRALGHHEYAMSFRSVDQHWKNLRKIYSTEIMVSRRLDDRQGLRGEKVRELVAFVGERCRAGEAVDIGRAAFSTALNLMSSTIFSIDMVDPRSESPQYFKDLIWGIMELSGSPNVSDFFPMLQVFDLQRRRRRMATLTKGMRALIDEQIDRRMEGKGGAATTDDLLDSLILQHNADDSDMKMDRRLMQCLILELFVAGSDTSASTSEWAMAELLCNPKAMKKARAELTSTIDPGKELEESDIQRLPYLQAVVKETLRMHPPTPFLLPRQTEEEVEIGGYTLPKHTRVLVNAWAIGRDGAIWTDPDSFIPERFMAGDESNIGYTSPDFEMIPFGGGRRICPGIPLALRMVHLMVGSLLHPFSWKLADGMGPKDVDMNEKFGITLAKAIPLRAIPVLATS